MARSGKFVQEKKKRGKGKKMILWLLLAVLLARVAYLIGYHSGKEAVVPMEQESVISTTSAHTEPEAQETTVAEATTQPETEGTTVPIETEALETVEPTVAEEPAFVEISEEQKAIYAEVLEQYRQAILMDTREFMELHSNEENCIITISSLTDAYSPPYDVDRIKSSEELVGIAKEIMDRVQLPTLISRYPYINQYILSQIHMSREEGELYSEYHEIYYTYYDVDANGSAELLIGDCSEYRDHLIALYTIRDGKPSILVNTIANRSYMTIYADGTIGIDASGSASIHTWDFYCLDSSWGMLRQVAEYYMNYKYDKSELVQQSLDGFLSELSPVTRFAWQPLFPTE